MHVAWNKVTLSTGAWLFCVHRTCAETAAISPVTSHVYVTTKQGYCNHFGEYAITKEPVIHKHVPDMQSVQYLLDSARYCQCFVTNMGNT